MGSDEQDDDIMIVSHLPSEYTASEPGCSLHGWNLIIKSRKITS